MKKKAILLSFLLGCTSLFAQSSYDLVIGNHGCHFGRPYG